MLRIRIRCLFDPWIRDPGWVKIKIRIREEHPGSQFRELINNFLGQKLEVFDANADPGIFLTLDPGSGMEKFGSGIRNISTTDRLSKL
jgi:hypothetical protein